MGLSSVIQTGASIAMWLVILGLLVQFLQFSDEFTPKKFNLSTDNQQLLNTTNTKLLNGTGHLIETGWSTKPTKMVESSELAPVVMGIKWFNTQRYKQFEYHLIKSEDYIIFFGIANLGYAGKIFVGCYDFKTNKIESDGQMLLPWEQRNMNDQAMSFELSKESQVQWEKNGLKISYYDEKLSTDESSEIKRNYMVESTKMGFESGFSVFKKDSDEGHFQVEPIDDEQKYWHLGFKQYNMPVFGMAKWGDRNIEFSPEKPAVGMVDYGKGLFEYKTHWIWISMQTTLPDGRKQAFNFGGGIQKADQAKTLEDYIVLDGKTILVEPVEIKFDRNDETKPWQLVTHTRPIGHDNRTVELEFFPTATYKDSENFIVIRSQLVQNFGFFSGTIIDDKGETLQLDGEMGVCEWHYAHW